MTNIPGSHPQIHWAPRLQKPSGLKSDSSFKSSHLKTGSWTLSRFAWASRMKRMLWFKAAITKAILPWGRERAGQVFLGQRFPPVSTLIPHRWSDNQKTALSWNHGPENCPCEAHRSGAVLMVYGLPTPVLTLCGQLEIRNVAVTPEREAAACQSGCFNVGMWAPCRQSLMCLFFFFNRARNMDFKNDKSLSS